MRLMGWTSKKYNPDGEAIGIEILPDRVAFAALINPTLPKV